MRGGHRTGELELYHLSLIRKAWVKVKVSKSVESGIEPLDPTTWWDCPNLDLLRAIDSDSTGEGVPGDKFKLKRLKLYLKGRKNGSAIAKMLYFEDDRIKTRMPYASIFLRS